MNEEKLTIDTNRLPELEKTNSDLLFMTGEVPEVYLHSLQSLRTMLMREGRVVRSLRFDDDRSVLSRRFHIAAWIRCLSQSPAIHCIVSNPRSLWLSAIPAIVMGRFFGRRVIVQLVCSHLIDHIVKWRSLLLPVLALADAISVESRLSDYRLTTAGLKNSLRTLPLADSKTEATIRKRVQPKMLAISPLDDDHNPLCALRGFQLIKQKYPRAELTIAGSGPLLYSLKQHISDRRIHGLTLVTSWERGALSELYGEADLFVHVASSSCGVTWLIEALSRGLPVVTTDESNALEVIRDKHNGLVFGINSHVEMAERVITLIESPALVESLSKQAVADSRMFGGLAARANWLSLYR